MTVGLAEVDLGLFARLVTSDDGHVGDPRAELGAETPHDVAHGGLRDLGMVLVDQALPDAPGRVALLAGGLPVGRQPAPG